MIIILWYSSMPPWESKHTGHVNSYQWAGEPSPPEKIIKKNDPWPFKRRNDDQTLGFGGTKLYQI